MHKRVNEEIRDKGIPGMRILIIDALLKLRQTCCDPRLVKLKMADGITDSAKLLTLMDMLPQLVEEGEKNYCLLSIQEDARADRSGASA